MDNFDYKKYLREGKLNEGSLMDESSMENEINAYIYDVTDLLKEMQSLEPQLSLKQIQEILSSIKYLTDELDLYLT